MGAIVGGAVGGVVVVAAVVTLATLAKTGRLKSCDCCTPTNPVAVNGPVSGDSVASGPKTLPNNSATARPPPAYGARAAASIPGVSPPPCPPPAYDFGDGGVDFAGIDFPDVDADAGSGGGGGSGSSGGSFGS